MLVVAAHDDGRLRGNYRLRPHFQAIHELFEDDRSAFLSKVRSIDGACILFWHADIRQALRLLSKLHRTENWPENLGGVVLFRAVNNAGLRSRSDVQDALSTYSLAGGQVHIMSAPVDDPPHESVVDRILNFCKAVENYHCGALPFHLLEPTGCSTGVLTLLILDRLISHYPDCEQLAMKSVDWTAVANGLQHVGISCPLEPTAADVKRLAAGARLSESVGIHCSGCSGRGLLSHSGIEQGFGGPYDASAQRMAVHIIAKARDLIDDAERFKRQGYDDLRHALAFSSTIELEPQLNAVIASVFQDQCGLLRNVRTIRKAIEEVEAVLQKELAVSVIKETLGIALACRSHSDGVRF